jgi:hypothetical protein
VHLVLLAAGWMCLAPAQTAHADWLIIPFVGSTFGVDTAFLDLDVGATSSRHVIFGASAAWLGDRVFGVEGDFAYSPGFFEGDQPDLVLGSQVSTLSGNVLAAVPLSVTGDSLRPFVLAGLGLVHSNSNDQVGLAGSDDSLGLQLGGGAIGFVSDRAALRFDLRHVRTLSRTFDPLGQRRTKLSFWRATIGVAIRY